MSSPAEENQNNQEEKKPAQGGRGGARRGHPRRREGENSTRDRPNNAPRNNTEGSTRGTAEGSARGNTEGSSRGRHHNAPRNTTEGSTRGSAEGSARGNTEGSSRGRHNNAPRSRHIPKHHHKVDMKKYEEMIGAAQANFADIKMSSGAQEECTICWKFADLFGVGTCRHPVCIECAIRIRVITGLTTCSVCRGEMPQVYLTFASSSLSTVDLNFPLSGHPDEDRYGIRFQNKDAGERYEKYLAHVCRICKTPDGEPAEFPSFMALRQHVSTVHGLSYCHICTDNLHQFTRERKTYNRHQLQVHIKEGDPEDRSQKGHPSCLFCEQRFFDNEAQYKHLRKDHFFCQFCESSGTMSNQFFGKHHELLDHYKKRHFICESEECKSMGIAFSTKFDLDLHKSTAHNAKMTIGFNFADRQQQSRGRPHHHHTGQSRFSSIPEAAPIPTPPQRECVIVPSAQSRTIVGRNNGPVSVSFQDFPSLAGENRPAPSTVVSSPQQYPRLTKVGRTTQVAKKPVAPPVVEAFPTLGGKSAPAPAAPPSNWLAEHTQRFEVIDDDERRPSGSRSKPTYVRAEKKTVVKPKSPSPVESPVEEYPSLPPAAGLPKVTNWAKKAQGKNAIVGLKMPKKKALPVPDSWPERSVAPVSTPAREPIVEEWRDIPITKKKITRADKRELKRLEDEAEALRLAEEEARIRERMMIPPDEDLEMQAILMNDVTAVRSPVVQAEKSTATTKSKKKKIKENPTVATGRTISPLLINNDVKMLPISNNTQNPVNGKKTSDNGQLQPGDSVEPQASSWLSSVTSMFSGLSLSNIMGDLTAPLSTQSSVSSVEKQVTPVASPTTNSPPGLSLPPGLAPPPGLEHMVPAPPPGMSESTPNPMNDFSSAPFLSHDDVRRAKKTEVLSVQNGVDMDGWVKPAANKGKRRN